MGKYDDIIKTPYPFPLKHPRMPLENRAPQFAPFAALTGFDEMVDETARLTSEKHELTEEAKLSIGEKISKLLEINREAENSRMVNITYFRQDAIKSGGEYITAILTPYKFAPDNNILLTREGVSIKLEDIYEIEEV